MRDSIIGGRLGKGLFEMEIDFNLESADRFLGKDLSWFPDSFSVSRLESRA